MAHETGKMALRRVYDARWHRWLRGDGIDLGAGRDPLSLYADLFPAMGTVRAWDVQDGDAQELPGVADASVDWIHASHLLEHVRDPLAALVRWLQVVKIGGYVLVTIPDGELYEHGEWPSRRNGDHKTRFACGYREGDGWCDIVALLVSLPADVIHLSRNELTFRPSLPSDIDQTLTPCGECSIEFVLRRTA